MLKKLFTHEWKESWKMVTLFNVIVIVFTLIGALAMTNKNWAEAMEENEWYAIIFMSYFMLYYFAILALSLATTLYFFIRFYRNFYTDQGYLMHTLPVTSNQLIISKALVMYIWQMLSGIVICISVFVLINGFIVGAGEDVTIWELFAEIFSEIEVTPMVVAVGIISVFMLIGSQISAILFGYLAISLGQLSKNHKLIASIGIYMGMQTLLQMLGSVFQIGFNVAVTNIEDVSDGLVIAVMLLITIVLFAVDAAMYAGSNYIMKNKLNLE
ncbi:MAG: hypothetical protein IJN92_03280 [Lachnospiraceae bacterium]|nr:hypothetical protein [Lachnospiraceae bacterium]